MAETSSLDYSEAPTNYVETSSSLSPESSVRQPYTPKETFKRAGVEDKTKVVEKKDVYTTVSTGDLPTKPNLDYTNRVADFYRSGVESLTGDLEKYPRALEPYEQENVASIRVFGKPKGKTTSADLIPAYTKFILDSVQESHTERSQIVETFGDFYVFMFGQRPPVYNFSGTLINAKNASWVTDFMYMYELYLRGSRCVDNNAVAIITYGGRQIEGLILNTSNQTMAATEAGVPFQFSIVVFERRYYNFSPDMGYSLDTKGVMSEDKNFIEALEKTAGKTGKGTSSPDNSAAHGETSATIGGKPSTGIINK
jgi:hypothetical protein